MSAAVQLRSVRPGINPGGLWSRLCTDDDELLAEHALSSVESAGTLAGADRDQADAAVVQGKVVRNFIYDGDTGACVLTVVMHP